MIQQDDLKTEELISIENLLKSVKDFDRLILEAVDAGIESGRSIGVIEAYNILIREGYGDVAELLMNIISDDDPSAKTKLES
jgi:septum formation inhibitor-activating ATPase MinD